MKVAILGSTGLVGHELLQVLLTDQRISHVRLLLRKPIAFTDKKIESKLFDFQDESAYPLALEGCDAVFVSVGTTMRKVKGDRALYRTIDFDIPVFAANAAASLGIKTFALVSAVGADANNTNFYLRLKGSCEQAVLHAGIPLTMIARPSILLGDRKEKRPAEKIAQAVFAKLNRYIPAKWDKYKAIHARDVARSLVSGMHNLPPGSHILEYRQMMALLH